MRGLFTLGLFLFISTIVFHFYNESKVETINDCKVLKLQQQSIIKGTEGNMSTEIRYLVITDKETFICETSLVNGKFNNSDIFWRLKEDSVYNFKVSGIGKSLFTDYRNIIEYTKKSNVKNGTDETGY